MMSWDFNAMLWDVYAMLWENEMNGLMMCYAMVFYEIQTKMPPYTEDFLTFWRKIIKSQSLPIICNVNIYSFELKHLKRVKIILYAMLL